MSGRLALANEEDAAYWAGRPRSTIRRWAGEGRIQRYGSGRGNIRYNVLEIPKARRNEDTRELITPGVVPPFPATARAA